MKLLALCAALYACGTLLLGFLRDDDGAPTKRRRSAAVPKTAPPKKADVAMVAPFVGARLPAFFKAFAHSCRASAGAVDFLVLLSDPGARSARGILRDDAALAELMALATSFERRHSRANAAEILSKADFGRVRRRDPVRGARFRLRQRSAAAVAALECEICGRWRKPLRAAPRADPVSAEKTLVSRRPRHRRGARAARRRAARRFSEERPAACRGSARSSIDRVGRFAGGSRRRRGCHVDIPRR